LSKLPLPMISGWAHPADSLKPLAEALAPRFLAETLDAAEGDVGARLQRADAPLFLLGWSMGGMIAIEAAETSAGRIAGLVLVSTSAKFCASEGNPYGAPERNVRAMAAAIRKDPVEVLSQFFRNTTAPAELAAGELKARVDSALSPGVEHLSSGLRYLQLSDCRTAAKSLNIPSLVCHGGEDRVIPWQAGRQLSELLPRAQFVKFDGIGHDLPLRAPQALANEIVRFAEAIG
jgi:pimeloyl-[acyl-carrier protein] methyl ester esterase